MSAAAIKALKEHFGERILEVSDAHGDDEVTVAPSDWSDVALFLRDSLSMDHFVDLTAVDYPEREPDGPRFDVYLLVRSMASRHRVRMRTRVADEGRLASLTSVWAGANWAEREVYDMFGVRFEGHPDLRRILMYPEFVGHPLRKDYPIEKAQPLVPYREEDGIEKLPPFGVEEGQPWGRIDWRERLGGRDRQVSPSIALQTGQRRILSDTDAYNEIKQRIAPTAGQPATDSTDGQAEAEE